MQYTLTTAGNSRHTLIHSYSYQQCCTHIQLQHISPEQAPETITAANLASHFGCFTRAVSSLN